MCQLHFTLFTERIPRCYRSFDHLRTIEEVSNRITQFTQTTGTKIMSTEHNRLSTLWILLKDNHLISTLIRQARIVNDLCANLIKIFVNISKIEWGQPTPPGGSIKQLGFDLLRCILAADVEWFYHHATNDVRDHSYHLILPSNNLMDLMFLKHHHPADTIIPDQCHVIIYLIKPMTKLAN